MQQAKASPDFRLIDIQKITGKQIFSFNKKRIRIGRSPENDLIIPKSTISNTHAVIEYEENHFFITDLGSTNKTILNNKQLKPNVRKEIRDGDEIVFDVFKFTFALVKPDTREQVQDDEKQNSALQKVIAKQKSPRQDRTGVSEKQFIGKYECITRMGKGGFGNVWKARDPEGKICALKVLNPENLEDERAVRKFFHEAIILSHLDHPNITQFIDFFPKDQNYVIAMDFVEGTDLKTLLRRLNGPFPFDMACEITGQILDAFQYAYEKGILHRDIKPENIILDTDGNPKIMDFGIAKMSSASSQKTAFSMISPLYTPPERFDPTSEVNVRSDIYSMGIVLYEIFTGKHPIDESNPSRVIFAHINQLFDPPDQYVDIPRSMSRAISKALEKDPKDRFEDFAAFKKTLLEQNGQQTLEKNAEPKKAVKSDEDQFTSAELKALVEATSPLAEHSIEFTPEYFQVSVAMLNYFVETLKKYPKKDTAFSITQEKSVLRLSIQPARGELKVIERDMQKIMKAVQSKAKK